MPVISIVVTCARRKEFTLSHLFTTEISKLRGNSATKLARLVPRGLGVPRRTKAGDIGGNQCRYMPRTHRSRFTPTAQGPPWSSVADAAPVFNPIRLLEIVVPKLCLFGAGPPTLRSSIALWS
ncbi:hypothetical protein GE21DRAFT_7568 [Neurospora crassa]|uniref:Uncharacterized protein n=2 Tax=Neurospora crassa TaxID=5141 RepID=Q1K753_NEUCR|nr:hypothetical protein NCU01153 [Neurospora crassa OR74A]EAA31824.1 hypothetical protein NCU01153 [Neurospora crassa OR74A]KHE88221.1 hypothetical protein GE21DRAFT_7568 [Neurospora crassa]CAD21377.1 hypothetical protein [Neurospora crassa]|eukprot:XP_961060.1 hypothetical protein NCU01153 [Neurospora crassa OR74A]